VAGDWYAQIVDRTGCTSCLVARPPRTRAFDRWLLWPDDPRRAAGGLQVLQRLVCVRGSEPLAGRHRRTAQKWITCFQQGKERLGGGARNGLGGYRNRKLKQEHYAFVYNLLQTRQDLYYDEYIDLLKAEFPGLRVDTSTLCRAFQRWGITRKAVRAVFLVPYAPVCRWQRATAARACTTLHLLVYMHPTYFVRARSTMFVAWSPPTAP
jgi:transposase